MCMLKTTITPVKFNTPVKSYHTSEIYYTSEILSHQWNFILWTNADWTNLQKFWLLSKAYNITNGTFSEKFCNDIVSQIAAK